MQRGGEWCSSLAVSLLCISVVSARECGEGRGDGLLRSVSDFLSLCLFPAEPFYLPHLAHGANSNQPFSGGKEAERLKEKERKRDARSAVVFDGSLGGVYKRKLEADAGVDQ